MKSGQDGMNDYYESKRSYVTATKGTSHVKEECEPQQRKSSASVPQSSQATHAHRRDMPRRGNSPTPSSAHSQQSVTSEGLCKVMQRQNEITEMLVKQQNMSQLPQRDIPVFTGDPFTYCSFIRAFEQAIENKIDNQQDKLYYCEQFTNGEPRTLFAVVSICDLRKATRKLGGYSSNTMEMSCGSPQPT